MIREMIPTAKGWITIYGIDQLGNKFVLLDRKNALVPNARKIIARCLGGDISYAINQIGVYKAGVLLAVGNTSVIFPSDYTVKFNTRFLEGAFNDTLDEAKLGSSTGGIFSSVNGISVLKDNTLQLEIEWLLTINNV